MKTYPLLIYLVLFFSCNTVNAQKIISGKSEQKSFTLQASYKRGTPPNLYAELEFFDENSNGIIEVNEKGTLKLIITNKGNGVAQGLEVNVIEQQTNDPELKIYNTNRVIPFLFPGKSIELEFEMEAGFKLKTAEHKLQISVLEHFGYDMDPAYLVLNTLEYQAPQLVFAGYEVVDYGKGTSPIIQDGQIQPGEMVKVKLLVQNTGSSIANGVKYNIKCDNQNVYLNDIEGTIEDIKIGEVASVWLTVSPNKRISANNSIPLKLNIVVDKKIGSLENYTIPVAMNQSPPAANILAVKTDWEKLNKQAAHFVYSSNKFATKIDSIINIREFTPSKTIRNNAIAVVFGIEKYDELPPAPYAENDARLIKQYFNDCLGIKKVVTYTSKEAKGLIFDDVFNPVYGELQKSIIKGQTDIFVYYSGHGIPSKDGNQLFLFPSDGRKERLELQGYNLSKFYENLEKLGSRSVTVFFDACFSGASKQSEKIKQENLVSMKGIRIKPEYYRPWEYNANFSVFSSSGPNETSLAFDISQTGLFTYYLCAGLQGNADVNNDNQITSGELYSYVKNHVLDISRKISGVQTPEFHGNENTVLVEY